MELTKQLLEIESKLEVLEDAFLEIYENSLETNNLEVGFGVHYNNKQYVVSMIGRIFEKKHQYVLSFGDYFIDCLQEIEAGKILLVKAGMFTFADPKDLTIISTDRKEPSSKIF